jgi:phage baseplate assembly protein W
MQGLAVVDGDLVLSGGSFLTVTGQARIKQDLTFALRDSYGADPNHPYWGSILDRYIGQPITPTLQQQIVDEVQRVLNNYIAVQADVVNTAVINNVRGSLNTSDVVSSVSGINVNAIANKITISVELQTMSRDSVTITRTVTL